MSARPPQRLWVVGASGLVGSALMRAARARGWTAEGSARRIRGDASVVVDLADPGQISARLAALSPDVIAVCSAWPHVDGCEKDPERSERENVGTVANLLQELRGSRALVIFFSTDHVFDGTQPQYAESAAVHPLSVYARHKRQVEELLLERGDSMIARTAWVFGRELSRKNYVFQVLRAAREGGPLDVVEHQSGCPTHSDWLARSTLELAADGTRGVVHLTGGELLTKAAWARTIAGALELPGIELREVPWSASGQIAPRPSVRLVSERHRLIQPELRSILAAEREVLLST